MYVGDICGILLYATRDFAGMPKTRRNPFIHYARGPHFD